jgi:hypothetical protein
MEAQKKRFMGIGAISPAPVPPAPPHRSASTGRPAAIPSILASQKSLIFKDSLARLNAAYQALPGLRTYLISAGGIGFCDLARKYGTTELVDKATLVETLGQRADAACNNPGTLEAVDRAVCAWETEYRRLLVLLDAAIKDPQGRLL